MAVRRDKKQVQDILSLAIQMDENIAERNIIHVSQTCNDHS